MDTVFLDVNESDMTLSEIMRMVEKFQSDNPGMDIFLDGDRKAIVGRPHAVQEALER